MNKKVLGMLIATFATSISLAACDNKKQSEVEEVKHEVSFYSEKKADRALSVVEVVDGEKVARPEKDPSKDDDEQYTYTFDNWYDYDTEEVFNFDTLITKDYAIYADYNKVEKEAEPYSISIYLGSQFVSYADTLKAEYAKVADPKCTANFVFDASASAGADVASAVIAYDNEHTDAKFNMVVGHKYVWATNQSHLYSEIADYWSIAINTKLVQESWVSTKKNTFAYNITSATTGFALVECQKIATILEGNNPDFFDIDTIASLGNGINEKQLSPLNYDGTSATGVTYESDNNDVATVNESGLISVVGIGSCVVKATKGSHVVNINVEVNDTKYDLVVYIAGHTKNKITEDEANAIIDEFTKEGNPGYGKKIDMNYSNLADGEFGNLAKSGKADVVIGSNNLDSATQCNLALYEGYAKVALGEGWVKDSARYIGVMADADAEHLELAKAFYDMFKNIKPGYLTITSDSENLKIGESKQIEANLESGITYESNDANIATVSETGLILAIAEGTVTISVIGPNNTKTIEVSVVAADKYTIVIYLSSLYTNNLATLKAEYAKVADANCNAIFEVSSEYKAEAFKNAAEAYDVDHSDSTIDLLVGHVQVWSKYYCHGSVDDMSYWSKGESEDNKYPISGAWGGKDSASDLKNTYGIKATLDGNKLAECQKIANILCNEMPA